MNSSFFSRKNLPIIAGVAVFLIAILAFALSPESFKAALLDAGDRPQDAVSSEFRPALVGIINYFLGFLGLVAVAFVVYAGVLMVTSQGEDEGTGKAKKILLWSAIGIIIVFLSYAIVNLIVGAGQAVA